MLRSPATRPSRTRISHARSPSASSTEGSARRAAVRAVTMCAPVASPPACTTRAAECAPSRARRRRPSLRSKRTPRASRVATWAGPSRQMWAAAAGSQRPAPAARVSARWASTESWPSIAAAIAALGPDRAALAEDVLGDDDDRAGLGRRERDQETAGDAASDHDHGVHLGRVEPF